MACHQLGGYQQVLEQAQCNAMQCVALSPTSSHWGSAQKAKHASADTAKMAYARTPGETGTLVAPRCTAYAAPIPAPTPCIAIAKDATASTITILAILLALSPTQKDSSQANPAAGRNQCGTAALPH